MKKKKHNLRIQSNRKSSLSENISKLNLIAEHTVQNKQKRGPTHSNSELQL